MPTTNNNQAIYINTPVVPAEVPTKRPSKMRPSNALTARCVLSLQMSSFSYLAILLETSVLGIGAHQILEGLPQILRCIGQDCPLKGNLYVQYWLISRIAPHSKCISFPQDYEKRAQNMVSMPETRSILFLFIYCIAFTKSSSGS